jgi:hypothetical protein
LLEEGHDVGHDVWLAPDTVRHVTETVRFEFEYGIDVSRRSNTVRRQPAHFTRVASDFVCGMHNPSDELEIGMLDDGAQAMTSG